MKSGGSGVFVVIYLEIFFEESSSRWKHLMNEYHGAEFHVFKISYV